MAESKHPLKSPYVWMLIAIPLSAVIMGGILLWLSITTFDGMVVDDYYERGLQINQELGRDQVALELGIQGRLQADAETTRVSLQSSDPGFKFPDEVQISFSHATRAGVDQALTLRRQASEPYRGAGVALAPGRWYIQLSAGEWRIGGSVLITKMMLDNAGSLSTPLFPAQARP